jgi:hypothetical protein
MQKDDDGEDCRLTVEYQAKSKLGGLSVTGFELSDGTIVVRLADLEPFIEIL